MRARKPLVRSTPMPRQSQPLKRSEIKASGEPMSRGPVKPRRRTVVSPEERAGKAVLKARSGGVCEIGMCGGARATDFSHRVRKSQGGSWSPVNGLHSCRSCHGTITTHPWECEAERKGWAIRSHQDPAVTPCVRRGEWVRLDAVGGWEPVDPAEWIGGAA